MKHDRLEELLTDASFVRWIKGESTTEQAVHWEAWLQKDPHHQLLREEAKAMIAASEHAYEVPDPLTELEKLDRTIDGHEKQQLKIGADNLKPFFRTYRSAIAAGLLFLVTALAGFLAYQNNLWQIQSDNPQTAHAAQQYTTGYGEKATFKLSDGSRIVLNAHSTLKFSSEIEKGLNTEVWLEGEAYFDITHFEDARQRTFTVHTAAGAIKVLGTKFVVKTFDDKTRTVLEKGKISIHIKNNPGEHILKPGKMARFSAGKGEVAIQAVNTQIYTSWINNKWVFEDTPMVNVARRMENTFDIEVVVGEKQARKHLTGSIKSTNLEVISAALAEILDTEIKKVGSRLLIRND